MSNDPHILVPTPIISPSDINEDSLRYLAKDSFALWALNSNILVDGNKLEFDRHKYLLPIYMDNSTHIVLVKAAQMGATVYQLLRLLWFLEQHQGTKAGLYFPNKELADNISKDRLTPMLASSPELTKLSDPDDKLALRKIGSSSLYMMYLEGKSSKDSVPMDYLSFDEVRLSSQKSIDQTMERIAHSEYKYKVFMSTCFPGHQKLIVRKHTKKYSKVPNPPCLLSFVDLAGCWQEYEALTFDDKKRRYGFKPITNFYCNGEKETVDVLFDDGSSVQCTPEHEFAWSYPLSDSGSKFVGYIPISQIFNKYKDYRREYVYNNLLVISNLDRISCKEQDAPYTDLFMYIMGAYVAEGCFLTDTVIRIAQLKDKIIYNKTIEWAKANGLNYSCGDTYINVSLCTRPDLIKLFSETNKSCETKQIPQSIIQASSRQLKVFIEGFVAGDGTRRNDKRWEITTTSPELSDQLRFVSLRCGYPAFVRTRPLESGKTKYEVSGSIEGYRLFGRKKERVYNDYFRLGRVLKVTPHVKQSVYDIEVAGAHNYVLENGCVVHNCGLPEDSIHKRFLGGKQYVWLAKCGCSDGVDLARTFPDCVVDDPKRGLYLRCPKCRYTIKDTQNGRYVPMNPGASYNSYHVSQLSSKFISLPEIWEFYKTTTNISEFYNGKLGLPWVDEENRGVSMDQLMACVDETLPWGTKNDSTGCAMGVDQGAGYVMAIIGDIAPNGKKRIRHIEIIENNNPVYMENGVKITPFKRLRELMKEFDVRLCVVDAMPNSNDALSFAQDFRSRVFLAWYQRDAKHTVQWGDKKKSQETIRKAGSFLKFKYTVVLARYLSLGASLGAWSAGNYICPDPQKLVQICRSEETNQLVPEAICERMFRHMCRLVKQFKVTNEETGEGRHEWIYAGGDPHLAHAMNYLNVALERLGRRALFTFA